MIKLNNEQLKAVKHFNGPMIVLAGPGSGKTTVITCRVKTLIEEYGVSPNQIAVITFTRAAANEMNTRFKQSTNNTYDDSIMFGTFHSFFFKILKNKYQYSVSDILDNYDRKNILKSVMSETGISLDRNEKLAEDILNKISYVKNNMEEIIYNNTSNFKSDFKTSIKTSIKGFKRLDFYKIFMSYEKKKDELRKIDFDDMLIKCYQLLLTDKRTLESLQQRYKYILIDEFQDINKVQYETIKLIALPENNLFIVGDDDQSIYRFRGANPEFMLQFPNEFKNAEKVIFKTNYRSTNQIISLANDVISDNKNRFYKEIKGLGRVGSSPVLLTVNDTRTEADIVAKKITMLVDKIDLDKIAVIYRTNMQSRSIIDAFFNYDINFILKDEMPDIYDHFITNDIFAYIRLAYDRCDDKAVERIYYKPVRMLSKGLIYGARNKGGILPYLLKEKSLNKVQRKKIDEFNCFLDNIKKYNAHDAIHFIRKVIGYDSYLENHAEYRGININGLFDIADELQEGAKDFSSPLEYIENIREITNKLRQKTKKDDDKKGVVLSTMHSAKGLEFNIVFIICAVNGVIPHEKCMSGDDMEEERRLFYVAMTRAKESLYISTVKYRHSKKMEISSFVKKSQ